MGLITTIQCDECKKRIEMLEDKPTPGAEFILRVTDSLGNKFFHCGVPCHRQWLAAYEKLSSEEDDMLPGASN